MTQTPQPIASTEHLNPDKLNAFIDGELPPAEQQGIEQHLATCHACTLRVLSATQLKAATARAGQRFAPPPEALARLTAQLHSQHRNRSRSQRSRSKPRASTPSAPQPGQPSPPPSCSPSRSSAGASPSNQHPRRRTTRPAPRHPLQRSDPAGHLHRPPHRQTLVPGPSPLQLQSPRSHALPPDTTLKGADLTYLNGQPAALLLFTIHKHEVSVFLTQRSTSPTLTTLPSTRAGFTLHTATTPDLRIIAVSDVNPADLDNLIAALVHAQTPI